MTEQQLIDALKTLVSDAHTAHAGRVSIASYHVYIKAMEAVVERYRRTCPSCNTTKADWIVRDATGKVQP